MATEAQINANRRNAQKSTGPRSPEGKAATSRNALKHGLCAEKHLLVDEDDDSSVSGRPAPRTKLQNKPKTNPNRTCRPRGPSTQHPAPSTRRRRRRRPLTPGR